MTTYTTPMTLTHERLRELLHYDPETGVFTWRARRSNRPAGSRAGTVRSDGYRQICISRVFHLEHRLVRFYVTGVWPANEVDHARWDKADNRATKLRDATRVQNCQNRRGAQSNSRSGLLGVCWDKRRSKWRADIKLHGRQRNLGHFDDKYLAKEFRDLAVVMAYPLASVD